MRTAHTKHTIFLIHFIKENIFFLFVDAGVYKDIIKRHGGWSSSTVAVVGNDEFERIFCFSLRIFEPSL